MSTTTQDVQTYVKTVWYDGHRQSVEAAVKKLNTLVRRHGGEVKIVSKRAVEKSRGWYHQDAKKLYGTEYTITAPAVAGEKAKLVGTFELAEDNTSVYRSSAPGFFATDLEPFVTRWQDCDHCRVKQRRHASFVCEREDGSRLVVGRNCAKAFLGLTFEDLVARLGAAVALQDDDEDEGFGGGGAQALLNTVSLMNACYKVALHFGGYSKDLGEEMRHTLSVVRKLSTSDLEKDDLKLRRAIDEAKYPDLDLEAFARYIDAATGDFGDNLRIATACEYVSSKRIGLILAGVGLFVGRALKRVQDEAARAALPAARLVAEDVGKRVEFTATVLRTHPYQSDFGGGLIIVIRGDEGANAVHFCSGMNTPAAGDRVVVRGTVKQHAEDKRTGEPQTILSRCTYKAAK